MNARRVQRVRRDDAGTSLILALILITVVALVISVVLSFADTNIRVTVGAIRPQAAAAATADGAAQVATNELRRGNYDGSTGQSCFGTDDTLMLTDFPSRGSSAYVTCSRDPGSGTVVPISSRNKPSSAILTLGTGTRGEDGLRASTPWWDPLRVHGGIFSNSNIDAWFSGIDDDAWVRARDDCDGWITSPDTDCNYGAADARGTDPNYPVASGPTTHRDVPDCRGSNRVIEFEPGRYTDADGLSELMSWRGCRNSVWHFNPGTYYFDFTSSSHVWTVSSGWLVGGTPSQPLRAGRAPSIPGSCVSPVKSAVPGRGVQFVFGGDSRMEVSGAEVELCGSYSATAPPIAIYGLKTATGGVRAESGCVVSMPYTWNGCSVLSVDSEWSSRLYVQGTTYTPRAAIDVSVHDPSAPVFAVGVIARALHIRLSSGFSFDGPVVDLPDDSLGYENGDTVVHLAVHVCPDERFASRCVNAAPAESLRATVNIVDPDPGDPDPGNRRISITNWAALR